MMHFWNNLHQICSKSKDRKVKSIKVLGAMKPKDVIRIAKIDHGHLCMREEELSLNNNYITEERQCRNS